MPKSENITPVGEVNTGARMKLQHSKISHTEWVKRTNGGRTNMKSAYFGELSKSWLLVSPEKTSCEIGKDFIDPSGNHGKHGWYVKYIGKESFTRSDWYIERLITRHGFTLEQVDEIRVVNPGAIYRIGEMSIIWAFESGLLAVRPALKGGKDSNFRLANVESEKQA